MVELTDVEGKNTQHSEGRHACTHVVLLYQPEEAGWLGQRILGELGLPEVGRCPAVFTQWSARQILLASALL